MKIYLAGPLFTSAERQWNVMLAKLLRETADLDVWLPQEQEPRDKTAKTIFEMDVRGLQWADAVIAIMDGSDPDSGTCWECGWAYASGKPVYTVRTDFRGIGEDSFCPFNLMLSESSTIIKVRPDFPSVHDVAFAIRMHFSNRKIQQGEKA